LYIIYKHHVNIYEYTSYKAFLKQYIDQNKAEKGLQVQMAKAAGCQRSYLSQVLNRDVQLTLDQSYGLVEFIGLDHNGSEYFLLLVQYERAGNYKYKEYLKKKLKFLKQENLNLSTKLGKEEKGGKVLIEAGNYYSHWSYLAIHISALLKNFNTAEDFSNYLGISKRQVRNVISDLQKMNFLENKNSKWLVKENNIRIKDDNQNIKNHHLNWRMKAIDSIPNYDPIDDLHYSSVLAISENDLQNIKSKLNKVIIEIRNTALESKPEKCLNFNIDFYKLF